MSKTMHRCPVCDDGHVDTETLEGYRSDCKSDSDKITELKNKIKRALSVLENIPEYYNAQFECSGCEGVDAIDEAISILKERLGE